MFNMFSKSIQTGIQLIQYQWCDLCLAGKLTSLEEFRVQREELMKQFDDLRKQLADQETFHKKQLYELDRKQVIDRDRLKKDVVVRVNQVAADFRSAPSPPFLPGHITSPASRHFRFAHKLATFAFASPTSLCDSDIVF